jgi:hypothetical protein
LDSTITTRTLGHRLFDSLYSEREQPLSIEPGDPNPCLDFAQYVAFDMWEELIDCFSDKAFANNVEILDAAESAIGLEGLARLVQLARKGRALGKNGMQEATRLCALISSEEKKLRRRGRPFNQLRSRRGVKGQLVIWIDQPENSSYTPPQIGRQNSSPFAVSRRHGSRQRGSRRKPTRRRGSRRITSRSAGGGSGGDDGGSEPPGPGEPWADIAGRPGNEYRPGHREATRA